jgi:hypothetical protein
MVRLERADERLVLLEFFETPDPGLGKKEFVRELTTKADSFYHNSRDSISNSCLFWTIP